MKIQFAFGYELNNRIGIPYETDGDPSRRYYDLKADSTLAEMIPEFDGYPELRSLVMAINRSGSALRTLG